jgi:hypothetical protein
LTADLTPAQAARLEAIEAAPYAEEAAVERVARAMFDSCYGTTDFGWDDQAEGPDLGKAYYRRLAVAAIDVMRGATDDGAIGRVRHNHVTRDIKPLGECPACDRTHTAVGAPATAEGDDRG